jgi:hypothetical protein
MNWALMTFLRKLLFFSNKIRKICTWRSLIIFFIKSWFFPFYVLFWAFFGLNTESWHGRSRTADVLFICLSSAWQLKCLRVSKTESYGISRICFEMHARPQCLHRQLKCLGVSKTESYGLSRICFEMTRQATMPSSKAWLCLADEQHISDLHFWKPLYL